MKKLVLMLAAAAVCCGAAVSAKDVKDMRFKIISHGNEDSFWTVVRKGALDAAQELGCKVEVDLLGNYPDKQLARFNSAVADGYDGIAVAINDDKLWDKPIETAISTGVPVIGINNDDSRGAQGNKRLCYVGQDDERAGYKLALSLFEEGMKRGVNLLDASVVMLAELPDANYITSRANGIRKAMAEYGISDSKVIDFSGIRGGNLESRISSYIGAYPKINFLISLGGIYTEHLPAALKAAGKSPGDFIVGGFDTAPATVAAIDEGYVNATIDQEQYLQGYFAVYTLYLYNKYGFTPNIDTGGYLIDTPAKAKRFKELVPLSIR